jgi:CRISPR-associated protein Csb2
MIGLEIYFLAGRYHATHWSRHPNEGDVAWPPHPWQLLRGLIATWHLKAQHDVTEAALRDLIHSLSADVPRYSMPPVTGGHTRHYMPLERPDKTTLIIDAFLQTGRDKPLIVAWPQVTLDDAQRATLKVLAERMGYVGRAESWAKVSLWEGDLLSIDASPFEDNTDNALAAGEEVVSILSPLRPDMYATWRAGVVEERGRQRLAEKRAKATQQGKPPDKEKLTAADLSKLEINLPSDLFDALQATTGEARKAGWNLMPGAQWVRYRRATVYAPRLSAPIKANDKPPTVARYALSSPVLPHLHQAIFEGEKTHAALIKQLNSIIDEDPQAWSEAEISAAQCALTGCDEHRKKLLSHDHLYILPESHGRRGEITHLTLYASTGFNLLALRAMARLQVLFRKKHHVQMHLIGLGQPSDFGGLSLERGESPLLTTAKVWESLTPFVATRHTKSKRDAHGDLIGSPRHDLRRLLSLQFPSASVEIEEEVPERKLRWLEFYTERKGGKGARGLAPPMGFRLTFSEPVCGPLAFGYGAHLGLGVFRAVR